MKNINEIVMHNIKYIRRMKGISQQELADKCGLTKSMISYYETNVVNLPMNNIQKIASALQISICDLLNEHDTLKKKEYDLIDSKIIKKIIKLKSLPINEQKSIWHHIDLLLEKYDMLVEK